MPLLPDILPLPLEEEATVPIINDEPLVQRNICITYVPKISSYGLNTVSSNVLSESIHAFGADDEEAEEEEEEEEDIVRKRCTKNDNDFTWDAMNATSVI